MAKSVADGIRPSMRALRARIDLLEADEKILTAQVRVTTALKKALERQVREMRSPPRKYYRAAPRCPCAVFDPD